MARRLWARESAGYFATITLSSGGAPVNITGWTFAMKLTRVRGTTDITLGMAGVLLGEGFRIVDAAAGKYSLRILPASLSGIADTTGNFLLFGDIIATLPDTTRAWLEDIELNVTEGPTP